MDKNYFWIPILVLINILSVGGILWYFNRQNSNLKESIESQQIKFKQLEEQITRSSTNTITKDEIENLLKSYNVNYSIIQNDLQTLHAEIKAINVSKSNSIGQNNINVPSTYIEQVPITNPIPTHDSFALDINHWYGRRASYVLEENFGKIKIPFGITSFEAAQDPKQAWDVKIYPREYQSITITSEKEDRTIVTHNSFQIKVDGKQYLIPINDSITQQVALTPTFKFNPMFFIGLNMGLTNKLNYDVVGETSISLLSYGKYRVNPEFSLLQFGFGYSPITKSTNIIFTPVAYNLNEIVPFLRNTYLYSSINYSFNNEYSVNIGIKMSL